MRLDGADVPLVAVIDVVSRSGREMRFQMQIECAGCGKAIDEEASVLWQSNAEGYDFCSSECRRKFEEQCGVADSKNKEA